MKVNLTYQEVIKLAYVTKEIIGYAWGNKLTNAQANCYVECFYTIQDLLEEVDKKYLVKHNELCNFFIEGRRLTNVNDQLQWEKDEKQREEYLNFKSKN